MKLRPFEIRMSLPPQQGAMSSPPDAPSPGFATGYAQSNHAPSASEAELGPVRSEPTIRRWIEELEEAIVVLDSGVIVESNSRAPSLFGRQEDRAILGCHIKDLVTEESLMRLANFLEFDDPEPAMVLGRRQDRRTFPLQLKAVASIIGNGRRLRVTSLNRCGAIDRAGEGTLPAAG